MLYRLSYKGDKAGGKLPEDATFVKCYTGPVQSILVVEDSKLIRSMLARAIAKHTGFRVVEAGSIAEAQTILDQDGHDFFVALLDLVLPDAVRGEVVDLVHAAGIPSIVFTTELNEEIRRSVIRRGAIDYVIKRDSTAVAQVIQLIQRLHKNRDVWVLAVDDSAAMRSYFERLLNNYFFNALVASSGEEALKMVAEHPEISLVITDYMMPDMDGFQLVAQLRKQYSRTQMAIIGCTGRDDAVIAARFLKEGANDFLVKPFWNEEFYQRVLQNLETVEQVRRLQELNHTKNRFVGVAAHDLRSPLGSVVNITDLLTNGYEGTLTSGQLEMVQLIRRSAEGMLAMINDLLDVTAIESGALNLRIESVQLEQVIREELRLTQPAASRKNIAIVAETQELPALPLDRRAVQQIVSNLVSNAVKYSYPDSVVKVTLTGEEDAQLFRVEDHGTGIPVAEQANLFQAFKPLSSSPTAGETSHGLGLAIVKLLVDAHGGSIRVESEPGVGSTFTVRLPYRNELPRL